MSASWLPRAGSGPFLIPGVFDALSARLAERAGFQAIAAGGGALARAAGMPDVGLMTLTELVSELRRIVDATSLPVIADAETGFGGAVNIRRTVQELERAGVSAFHIEDQDSPRRCGMLPGIKLVSESEMCAKVEIARNAIDSPELVLIGRTDAVDVEGIDRAIERGNAYASAGAHVVYVESLHNRESIERVAEGISTPKMMSVISQADSPPFSPEQLAEMGYVLVTIPTDLQRAVIFAMQETLECIATEGSTLSMIDRLITMDERHALDRFEDYLDLET